MILVYSEFIEHVKIWNKVYGYIISSKRYLTRKLNNIQDALEKKNQPTLAGSTLKLERNLKVFYIMMRSFGTTRLDVTGCYLVIVILIFFTGIL